MSKPGFYFYTGDWQKKTRVLSANAKAAWIDLLCLMDDAQPRGVVTLSIEQIARYLSMPCEVAGAAILELELTRVADVTPSLKDAVFTSEYDVCHSNVTVMSRRMMREESARETARLRQKRNRRHAHVTPMSHENTGPLPSPSPSPSLLIKDKEGSVSKLKSVKKESPLPAFSLPEWIDPVAWAGFVAMRVKIKKPMTDRAKQMLVTKLEAFKAAGADVAAILRQSEFKCWQDVYALKTEETTGRVPVPKFEPPKDEEISIEKRRENMGWLDQTLKGIGKGMK
jgi:hypothetical protein